MWESQTKQSTLENQIPSNAREIHVNPFFLSSFFLALLLDSMVFDPHFLEAALMGRVVA